MKLLLKIFLTYAGERLLEYELNSLGKLDLMEFGHGCFSKLKVFTYILQYPK